MLNGGYNPAPNRYASEQEAAILRSQIAACEADRTIAMQRVLEADTRRKNADALVQAAEQELLAAREAQQTAEIGWHRAQARVETLERDLTAARALLHPVRKAPQEVLGLIFEALSDDLHTGSVRFLTGHRDVQRTPFTLAAVCKTWRAAAIASTKLWFRIIFNFSYKTMGHSRIPTWSLFLSTSLARSGSRPLELTVVHDEGHHCAHMSPLYRHLQAALARAVSIRVTFHPDACDKFLDFMRCRAPKLQYARIATFFPPAPTTPATFDFFNGAHTLSTIELVHCLPKWKSACFHSVTTLRATWTVVPVQELVEMITAMPRVTDVTVNATSFVDGGGIVSSPYIRRLDLAVDVLSERLASGAFHFPALDSLILRFPRYNSTIPQRNLPTPRRLALMVSPCATIRDLRVDATKCDERFAGVLASLERLESIAARNAWLVPAFFSRLMLSDTGAPVCPALREMEFDACNLALDFDPEMLFAFVRSRSEPGARISPVDVRIRVVGDTLVPPWLKESRASLTQS